MEEVKNLQKEENSTLQENNNFFKWKETFEKGWKVRTIENKHLLDICFLEFLSTINKVRYVYGGQYKTVNISSFKIQQSGTGKGVGDKYVHDILRFLGYKVAKINAFTEAAVIGTVYTDGKGNSYINKGAIGEYDFLWIDEARNLIVGNQWSQGLLEVINGYLDDGRIFKKLAKGEIKYYSNCNFGTGTFFFEKLKPAILATGLFQRTLFSYKQYSKKEVLRISNKFNKLSEKDYLTDLLPIFQEMKGLLQNLDFEKYNIGVNHKNYVIKMSLTASNKIGEWIDEFFKSEILEQVNDKRLQNILFSFLIRSKELAHRIMCLYSVWNQKNYIDEESAEYAFKIIKRQLQYVLKFVSDVFEGTEFDSEDLSREDLKRKKILNTRTTILKTIKQNPGISKTDFRKYVQNHRVLFSCGELKIVNEILPTLIEEGKIRVEKGTKNETFLHL